MSLSVSSLNSGSNGNCYYIGSRDEAVLIDAGISCRETERRLKRQGLSIRSVKAIFITHEHTDHTAGLRKLCKKYQLPVYMTARTRQGSWMELRDIQVRDFEPHEEIPIGKLRVTAFPVAHDARDPHGFVVENDSVTAGVFTDLGATDEESAKYFRRCHTAFLESNYDEVMLETGTYAPPLKARIRGGKGHLSNLQALHFFLNHRPPFMSHLFLSHLSRNNNSPHIVQQLFSEVAGSTEVIVASRYVETGVFSIAPGFIAEGIPSKIPRQPLNHQLSLFG
ncbi:MAG: MBL fold metallo-hydrolase [Cytophagales bacterium]|nr:MBL fold metallo-hydrolase [Cytophagales bacterium]